MSTSPELRRIRGGYYETTDGRFEVIRGDGGCPWAGQWLYRSTTNRYCYSDPMRTLGECRDALAALYRDEAIEAATKATALRMAVRT